MFPHPKLTTQKDYHQPFYVRIPHEGIFELKSLFLPPKIPFRPPGPVKRSCPLPVRSKDLKAEFT